MIETDESKVYFNGDHFILTCQKYSFCAFSSLLYKTSTHKTPGKHRTFAGLNTDLTHYKDNSVTKIMLLCIMK